ncbi:hypothetical protein [Dactylosporangium sp. NPDC049140]|uniref:hypothetical protein n=1 Tax=Dactylosporangium sp. NPDC049140 TaxID=3155647 RepID=UPI0033D6B99E
MAAWRWYAGLGLGAVAVGGFLPVMARQGLYTLIGVAAAAAVTAGMRRYRPSGGRSWTLFGAAVQYGLTGRLTFPDRRRGLLRRRRLDGPDGRGPLLDRVAPLRVHPHRHGRVAPLDGRGGRAARAVAAGHSAASGYLYSVLALVGPVVATSRARSRPTTSTRC